MENKTLKKWNQRLKNKHPNTQPSVCPPTISTPNAPCLLQESWRNAVVILIWVEAGLFLAMVISGMARFCCK
jgi:hypothetical protein